MAARRNIIERRSMGETVPFDFEELERLRAQAATARPERLPTSPIEHEHEVLEITVEPDEVPSPPKHAGRASTVADPLTMSVLAEIERIDSEPEPEPEPPLRNSNRHLKPREK